MIGILGGGQLGRMLCLAAAKLGHRTVVLDPDAQAPAAQVCSVFLPAAYDDPEALDRLAALADVVTYEFENVPLLAVSALADRVPVFPGQLALRTAQDRLVEKRFLNDAGIPTTRYLPLDRAADLDAVVAELGGTVIVKTRRLGYDGKGQARVVGPVGLAGARSLFVELGADPDGPDQPDEGHLIAEALVDFEGELSVIGARDARGGVVCFAPTRNVHREGILATSSVPSGWDAPVEDAAVAYTTALLEAFGYVGVLGLELFVLADRHDGPRLVANEFAPRVHNSGHWTETACVVSQFEQHIRVIAGGSVVDPGWHSACEMTNLIGHDVDRVPEFLAVPRTSVHLYGKVEVRPGRKVGHVTRLL